MTHVPGPLPAGAVAFLLASAPVAATACVIQPPECPTARGLARLDAAEGDLVLFTETLDDLGGTAARRVLVECRSRQGVMVMEVDADWQVSNRVRDLFDRVLFGDAAFDPDRILTETRALGADATRVELGPGHCGCDLPAIPAPLTLCPEM